MIWFIIGMERQLLSTHQNKKVEIFWAHFEEKGDCLQKEIMQGTTTGKGKHLEVQELFGLRV